ncbi:hypothetical protein KI387_024675, partial [Taxus chinensis]
PMEEVKVEEPVVAKAEFAAEGEQEEEDQQSVCSECSVHNGTLSEEDADIIQVTQSVMSEEEQSAPSPIEEEKLGEIKS